MTLISSLRFVPRYFWNSSGWNHEIHVIYSINRWSFDASRRRDREGVNNIPARVHFYYVKWDLQLYARWKYRFTSSARTPSSIVPQDLSRILLAFLSLSALCVVGHAGATHVPRLGFTRLHSEGRRWRAAGREMRERGTHFHITTAPADIALLCAR